MKNNILIILFLITLTTTLFVNLMVYNSMIAQRELRLDKSNGSFKLDIKDVEKMIPMIPNVDVAAMPISVYKVPYLLRDEQFEEAIRVTYLADSINPYTYVGNYFRAQIYSFAGELDKAEEEAKKAFYGWPKNFDHYSVLNDVFVKKLDTVSIENVFKYADSLYPLKKQYKENYIKSLNLARAGYIIKIYLDAEPINNDSLIGQWQRMYEYSYGKVVYDPNTVISFSNQKYFKDTKGAKYKYTLEGTDLSLFFISNGAMIKKMNLSYSPFNNTLILIDTENSENPPQYFKKISSQPALP